MPGATPRPTLTELVAGGPSPPWRELGFTVEDDRFAVGSVRLSLTAPQQRGIVSWAIEGLATGSPDGLPTHEASAVVAGPSPAHANGALAIDHLVVITPALERTLAALEAAGLDLRRRREVDSPDGPVHQAFYRLGEAILEVVAPASERAGEPDGPARFWGIVFTVDDLDACAARLGERLGTVRDAVQPGRRIATVRRSAGLGLPVALMSP